MLEDKKYITLQEASKKCGCTDIHLALLCRRGELKANRVGKRWYTTEKWAEECFLNNKNGKNSIKETLLKSEDIDRIYKNNRTKFSPFRRLSFVTTAIALLMSVAYADASLGYPISSFVTSEVRLLKEVGLQNIDSVVAKSDFVVEEISNSFVLFPQNVKEVFQETTLAIKQKQKDISDSIYDKSVFALGRFTTTVQLARSHLLREERPQLLRSRTS